jgi:hypothetical protein
MRTLFTENSTMMTNLVQDLIQAQKDGQDKQDQESRAAQAQMAADNREFLREMFKMMNVQKQIETSDDEDSSSTSEMQVGNTDDVMQRYQTRGKRDRKNRNKKKKALMSLSPEREVTPVTLETPPKVRIQSKRNRSQGETPNNRHKTQCMETDPHSDDNSNTIARVIEFPEQPNNITDKSSELNSTSKTQETLEC